jgi:hypothetical protein
VRLVLLLGSMHVHIVKDNDAGACISLVDLCKRELLSVAWFCRNVLSSFCVVYKADQYLCTTATARRCIFELSVYRVRIGMEKANVRMQTTMSDVRIFRRKTEAAGYGLS